MYGSPFNIQHLVQIHPSKALGYLSGGLTAFVQTLNDTDKTHLFSSITVNHRILDELFKKHHVVVKEFVICDVV